ncbi:ATP-binding cassette domain-containing protein [Salmonella enterica]|uniref:ATP-binding cassette domain-containing protein n=1 Tax=Salmonella enterica TaxID=28901 RepID=UPI0015CAF38E|nr:ATP-binding cassette domain-containing protein [Salmonella enterica subsp. enterica serovar Typhimurium]
MIEFKNVSKHFGPTQVLHNIDLNIRQGEVVVIIGPSGSGKSTLLRCINKLEEITSGDLIVDGLKVNDPKVDERLIRQEAGMVFQQFYLFPHLTALENVMFGPLRVRGVKKEEAEKQAKALLAKVGLAEEGMTMVIVTHEIGFAEKVASRLIFIDKGRIAEDGSPQALIENPPSPRLQEFLQHVS